MRKRLILLVVPVILFTGACSTQVSSEDQGDGLCKQERSSQFVGITYSRSENYINCDTVDR